MPVIENKQTFSRNIRILFRQGAGLSLTTHARVLLCTAHDLRGLRLREIVAAAGITGRGTHSVATDLAEAGYVPQARRRPSPSRSPLSCSLA
jgi:DNA-binding IclR family transcriptional regulator